MSFLKGLKGKKEYKVNHDSRALSVTIEIDWEMTETKYYKDTISNIGLMARFWSGCPDKDSDQLTEKQLNFFLKLCASFALQRLLDKGYCDFVSPKICNEVLDGEEGYIPFDGTHGIAITAIENIVVPESDEFSVVVL